MPQAPAVLCRPARPCAAADICHRVVGRRLRAVRRTLRYRRAQGHGGVNSLPASGAGVVWLPTVRPMTPTPWVDARPGRSLREPVSGASLPGLRAPSPVRCSTWARERQDLGIVGDQSCHLLPGRTRQQRDLQAVRGSCGYPPQPSAVLPSAEVFQVGPLPGRPRASGLRRRIGARVRSVRASSIFIGGSGRGNPVLQGPDPPMKHRGSSVRIARGPRRAWMSRSSR